MSQSDISPSADDSVPSEQEQPPREGTAGDQERRKQPDDKSKQSKKVGSGDDEEEPALTPEDIEAIKNMKISDRFDKLDRDYFLYISLIHSTMKNSRLDSKDIDMAWAWVQKIISMPSNTIAAKREKNIYFLYLLVQLRENRLKGIFSRKPVQGSLNKAAEAFHGVKSPPKDKHYENKHLEPDTTLAHKSANGRTYMASKVLENNAGICCYVAVSSGLKDPVWITACGEKVDVPARDDLPVTVVKKLDDSVFFKKTGKKEGKSEVETKRRSFDERFRLTSFHQEIVNRVNEEMKKLLCEKSGVVNDPFLLQLIRKFQNDAIESGEYTRESPMDLLKRVRDKSNQIIKEAECRDHEIELLSDNLEGGDLNHRLVDLSSNLAMDPEDDVWLAAIQEEPGADVINSLKKHYPQCLIEALLTLLERQRQIIIDQDKRNFEELILTMKSELEENVQSWRKEYEELREEWSNVIKVLRDVEKSRAALAEENGVFETSLDVKKESVANRHFEEAMEAYQNARSFYLSADKKMNSLQCKIEEAQRRYLDSKKDLETETTNWSATICRLKRDIEMQEMLIKDLQAHL